MTPRLALPAPKKYNKIGGLDFIDFLIKVQSEYLNFHDPEPGPYTKNLKQLVASAFKKSNRSEAELTEVHKLMSKSTKQTQQQILTWLKKGESLDDIKEGAAITNKDIKYKSSNKVSTSDILAEHRAKFFTNYNPMDHPQFLTPEQTLPDGSVIYDIKDSHDAARHLSDVIYAQRGTSPWCVLYKLDGTNWSPMYWEKYTGNKTPDGKTIRKALFNKYGQLVSFNASDTPGSQWWTLEDKPVPNGGMQTMIPVIDGEKLITFDATGKQIGDPDVLLRRGDPKKGLYVTKNTDSSTGITTLQSDYRIPSDRSKRLNSTINLNSDGTQTGVLKGYTDIGIQDVIKVVDNRLITTVSTTPNYNVSVQFDRHESRPKLLMQNKERRQEQFKMFPDRHGMKYRYTSGDITWESSPVDGFETMSTYVSTKPKKDISGFPFFMPEIQNYIHDLKTGKYYVATDAIHLEVTRDPNTSQLTLLNNKSLQVEKKFTEISKSEYEAATAPIKRKVEQAKKNLKSELKQSKFQDFGHKVLPDGAFEEYMGQFTDLFKRGGKIMNYLNYVSPS